MANSLALSIVIGASAGGAFAAFGNLRGVMQRISQATRDLRQRQQQLHQQIQNGSNLSQSALAQLNNQYQRQEQLLNRLRASTRALGQSQAAIAANEANRARLRGQMMETAGLAYLAARPLRVGIEFEAAMSKTQALARLDKDSEAMVELREQARKLGAETSFTASQAAQAQGFLAMAGFNKDKILNAMPSTLDLARASDVDLQRTADIASNILSAFKLDASEMPRVADTLTMAFTTSNVSLEQLAETMKYVAPIAQEAGMSMEEAAAMSGMLGNVGIQGSNAGTALRAMITRLSAGTGALKKLGVSAKDSSGNLRAIPEILADVNNAMQGMGTADKIGIVKDMFGQYAIASGAELTSLAEGNKLGEYIKIVQNSAGVAAKTHAIMADNTLGALKTLQSAWEDLSISLTDSVNGPFRELIESIAEMLRGFSKWVRENQKLASGIVRIVVGLLAFKIGLLAVSYTALLAAAPFLHLVKIFRMLHAAALLWQVGGIAAMFPRLAVGAGFASTKLKAFWALLAPARAVAAVGAFHGLVAVLRAVAWAFGAIVHPLKSIRVAFTAVRAGFAALRVAMLAGGTAALTNPIVLAITAVALAAWLIIKHWDKVKAFFAGFWAGVSEMAGPVVTEILGVFTELWTMLGAVFDDLRAGFAAIASSSETLAPVIEWLADALRPVIEWFGELGISLDSCGGAGYALGKIIGGIIWLIGKALVIALWLVLVPIRAVIAIIGGLVAAWRWAAEAIAALDLGAAWQKAKDGAASMAASVSARWRSLVNDISWHVSDIASRLAAGWQAIGAACAAAWAYIKAGFSAVWNALVTSLQAAWQAIYGFFAAAPANIRAAFFEAPQMLVGIGGQIMEGLWQGLKEKWEKVKALVSAVGEDIKSRIKDALGIASPSKVMMEIGGFAMQGLQMGMANAQDGPLALVTRLSEGILSALRAPLANLGSMMAMPPMQPMPALTGAFAAPGAANGNQMSTPSAGLTVNIVVNPAPGMDEKKLAFLVTQKLKEAQLGQEARARSRLADAD
ncbi:MAG: phage tail tape measure protein [Zoogloeaceae bacterium]|jgi:TP901 family phage tail tape measure protein|nr:phage tail tape measure protein [Zoogloeaceae bacterium]